MTTLSGVCPRCGVEHVALIDDDTATQALWAAVAARPALAAALAAHAPKTVGCAVARGGGDEVVVLIAVSGDLAGEQDVAGCVPSVIRREATAALERETLAVVKEATATLSTSLTTAERTAVRARRRRASATLMSAMIDHTRLVTRGGQEVALRDAFVGGGGIPSGTADCALPKLLVHANREGLVVTSVSERRYEPGAANHAMAVAPCARRCVPILGTLLCPR